MDAHRSTRQPATDVGVIRIFAVYLTLPCDKKQDELGPNTNRLAGARVGTYLVAYCGKPWAVFADGA